MQRGIIKTQLASGHYKNKFVTKFTEQITQQFSISKTKIIALDISVSVLLCTAVAVAWLRLQCPGINRYHSPFLKK